MAASDRKRILCVEPEKDFCELLTLILTDFDFINVKTKHEAIEHARAGGFSLILLETLLIDGTGEETCQQIRIFDKTTPILFVTGSRSFSETNAQALGAQGTIRKSSPRLEDDLISRTVELALS